MNSKNFFYTLAVSYLLTINLASANPQNTRGECSDFVFSIHNTTNENLTVNYELPPDGGLSASGKIIKPGETLPPVAITNPRSGVGFASLLRHGNVWVNFHIYNQKGVSLFNGTIIKDAPTLVSTSWLIFTYIDPPGKIYKLQDGTFNASHYVYTEEEKFDGSCAKSLSGKYTVAVGSK